MLEQLGKALPPVAPPDDLYDRIEAEIRVAEPARVVPLRRRVPGRAVLVLGAVAAAAAVVLAVVLGRGGPAPDATARIVPHLSGTGVHGTARLYLETRTNGTMRLALSQLPPPPRGHHYEVWVLARGQKTMTSVGTFTPATRRVSLRLPLPAPARYAAVDISVEENGGPAAHSNVSLAGGVFQQRS